MKKCMTFNRIIAILLMFSAINGVWGCSARNIQQNPDNAESNVLQSQEADITQTVESAQTVQSGEEDIEPEIEQEKEAEQISDIYFAYHTLDKQRQKMYLEVLHALQGMEGEITVSTLDTDELNQVFTCVMSDHPELFYVEGYQYTKYTTGDTLTKLTFSGTYSMSVDEMKNTKQQIDAVAESMIEPVSNASNQYSIVKYLYDTLITATEYDTNAENNQNICSVFLQGRSVCQGYAKAMQYLLQKRGIQALLVTGYTNGEGHAWNLVKVNGAFYYLDPTWGDASYTKSDEEDAYSGQLPPINYDYFLVTTSELTQTHQLDSMVSLPECTATQDNYYVHEGLYLDSYDEDRLKVIFQNAVMNNGSYVTMKCSNEAVFEQVQSKLINEQEVFRFLGTQGSSIAYTTNQTQLTISFWL